MSEHPEPSEVLTSLPSEMEASIVVGALEADGIRARLAGDFTAKLRVGVPSWVQVLVFDEDLERAQAVLEQVKQGDNGIDWSQVDVGEAEDSED
jgi:hypothetical protein